MANGGDALDDDRTTAGEVEAKAAVRAVLREGGTREVARRAELENERAEQDMFLRLRAFESELDLRVRYARWLLWMMVGQLVAANAIFVTYAWVGQRWKLEPEVVNVWLGATVVQVIGVVAVVTRHLFPDRDRTPLDL